MSHATHANRRLVVRAIKFLILAFIVWWVWQSLHSSIIKLDRSDWTWDWRWLSIAGGWYLVGLLPAGLYWHRVLASLGQHPPLSMALRAYYIGHLGKYAPGKAWVVVLRSGLLRDQGVRAIPAVISVFVETLTMMAVGAAVAAVIGAILLKNQSGVVLGGLFLMVVAGAPTLPPVLNRLFRLRWAAPLFRTQDGEGEGPLPSFHPRISWRLVATGWILNVTGWFLIGISLWAVLRSLVPATEAPFATLPHYTTAVAMAMVAGFLSGLPGGIGVRDGILIVVLTELIPPDTALVATVLLRIVWLMAEVMISGILYLGGMRSKPTPMNSNH
ncbi:MAG: flippase-like domain-containing protein [Pirellulales bacterium]|nr:flippase-like domain-containing protein [Pirellulales bacterium]